MRNELGDRRAASDSHLGGVFWAGTVWVFASYLEPTAAAAGPEGGRFLQRSAGSGYTPAVMSAGIGTIVAGIALIRWRQSAATRHLATRQGDDCRC